MRCIFLGTGVALVTPFYNGVVDYKSLNTLIENCIKKHANSIVILATTGEGSTITDEERKSIIVYCKTIIGNRVKLIVGTGSNNFNKCYAYTKQAKELGADAVLIVTPYYNKTTQQGLIEFYKELSKIEIPIIMYNVPSRTGLMIEEQTINKIISSNNYVVGLKESTCDIKRIINLSKICKNKIALYSGEDELNYIFYCLGAQGSISVTANAYPDKVQEIYELCKVNKYLEANTKQNELQSTNSALFLETNPVPIKYLLNKLNLIQSDEVRLPLIPLLNSTRKTIDNLIK